MKLHYQICWGLLLLLASTWVSYADSAKDQQIQQMLKQIDQAFVAKDATVIDQYLAEHIHIVMELTTADAGKENHQFTKTEYLDLLRAGWRLTDEYSYCRDKLAIKHISNGNKAVVTTTVYELSVVMGQEMAARSNEKMVIEFREGVPVIISLTAVTEVKI